MCIHSQRRNRCKLLNQHRSTLQQDRSLEQRSDPSMTSQQGKLCNWLQLPGSSIQLDRQLEERWSRHSSNQQGKWCTSHRLHQRKSQLNRQSRSSRCDLGSSTQQGKAYTRLEIQQNSIHWRKSSPLKMSLTGTRIRERRQCSFECCQVSMSRRHRQSPQLGQCRGSRNQQDSQCRKYQHHQSTDQADTQR